MAACKVRKFTSQGSDESASTKGSDENASDERSTQTCSKEQIDIRKQFSTCSLDWFNKIHGLPEDVRASIRKGKRKNAPFLTVVEMHRSFVYLMGAWMILSFWVGCHFMSHRFYLQILPLHCPQAGGARKLQDLDLHGHGMGLQNEPVKRNLAGTAEENVPLIAPPSIHPILLYRGGADHSEDCWFENIVFFESVERWFAFFNLMQLLALPLTMCKASLTQARNTGLLAKYKNVINTAQMERAHIIIGYTVATVQVIQITFLFVFYFHGCNSCNNDGPQCQFIRPRFDFIFITGMMANLSAPFILSSSLFRHSTMFGCVPGLGPKKINNNNNTVPNDSVTPSSAVASSGDIRGPGSFYKVWHRLHLFLAAVILGALLIHTFDNAHFEGRRERPQIYQWLGLPVLLYAFDRFIVQNYLWSHKSVKIISFEKAGDKLWLRVEKPRSFVFHAGDIVYMRLPRHLAWTNGNLGMRWPLSIVSPEILSNSLTFIIRRKHGVTQTLWNNIDQLTSLEMSGPYSSNFFLRPNVDQHVLVGLGTGCDAILSLLSTMVVSLKMVDKDVLNQITDLEEEAQASPPLDNADSGYKRARRASHEIHQRLQENMTAFDQFESFETKQQQSMVLAAATNEMKADISRGCGFKTSKRSFGLFGWYKLIVTSATFICFCLSLSAPRWLALDEVYNCDRRLVEDRAEFWLSLFGTFCAANFIIVNMIILRNKATATLMGQLVKRSAQMKTVGRGLTVFGLSGTHSVDPGESGPQKLFFTTIRFNIVYATLMILLQVTWAISGALHLNIHPRSLANLDQQPSPIAVSISFRSILLLWMPIFLAKLPLSGDADEAKAMERHNDPRRQHFSAKVLDSIPQVIVVHLAFRSFSEAKTGLSVLTDDWAHALATRGARGGEPFDEQTRRTTVARFKSEFKPRNRSSDLVYMNIYITRPESEYVTAFDLVDSDERKELQEDLLGLDADFLEAFNVNLIVHDLAVRPAIDDICDDLNQTVFNLEVAHFAKNALNYEHHSTVLTTQVYYSGPPAPGTALKVGVREVIEHNQSHTGLKHQIAWCQETAGD